MASFGWLMPTRAPKVPPEHEAVSPQTDFHPLFKLVLGVLIVRAVVLRESLDETLPEREYRSSSRPWLTPFLRHG
jgi:hypothetical protein